MRTLSPVSLRAGLVGIRHRIAVLGGARSRPRSAGVGLGRVPRGAVGAAWPVGRLDRLVDAQHVLRVLLTRVYNNTGKSVFAVVLMHAMANLA